MAAALSVGVREPAKLKMSPELVTRFGRSTCGVASVEKRGGAYVGYRKYFIINGPGLKYEVGVAPRGDASRASKAEFEAAYQRACTDVAAT